MNSRHYITALLLVLISSSDVYPLLANRFSVKMGIGWTNQSVTLEEGNVISSTKRLPVPSVAIFIDLFATDHFSFVTGMEYQQRGVGESVPFYNSWLLQKDEWNGRFHYLSIPLLARYRYRIDAVTPYGLGGLSVNFNPDPLSGERFVLDGILGAGIVVENALPLPMFAEGRYAIDITPAWNAGLSVGLDHITSNSFELAVGILL